MAEFKRYIFWQGRWRHVYPIAVHEQLNIDGGVTKLIEFKTSKGSKITYMAERNNFHMNKPAKSKGKEEEA